MITRYPFLVSKVSLIFKALKQGTANKTNSQKFAKVWNDKGKNPHHKSFFKCHSSQEMQAQNPSNKDKGITQEVCKKNLNNTTLAVGQRGSKSRVNEIKPKIACSRTNQRLQSSSTSCKNRKTDSTQKKLESNRKYSLSRSKDSSNQADCKVLQSEGDGSNWKTDLCQSSNESSPNSRDSINVSFFQNS